MHDARDPLRVLIAAESYAPAVNGVAGSVARLEAHLRRRGHEVMVVAPAPGPSSSLVVRVPSRNLPFYSGLPVGLPSNAVLNEAFERFRPDVVHLAAPVVLGARVAVAASRRGLPIVAIFQTDLSGFAESYGMGASSAVLWRWLRRVHRVADVTLAPSTATADELRRRGLPRVGLWGRGVDLDLFFPERRNERFRRTVLDQADLDTPLVGYMGRLAREKRIELLAGVARWPDARVVIVGDGPARPELERALPNAHFTGLLRGVELAAALASFDVFVHTGAHETFCQAIQEAMASGLPVIAPAAGGPLDLVEPEVTGLLYPPSDAPIGRLALERSVRRLLDDPQTRASMGSEGRARTAERSWDKVCDELIEVYRRCRSSRGRTSDLRSDNRQSESVSG